MTLDAGIDAGRDGERGGILGQGEEVAGKECVVAVFNTTCGCSFLLKSDHGNWWFETFVDSVREGLACGTGVVKTYANSVWALIVHRSFGCLMEFSCPHSMTIALEVHSILPTLSPLSNPKQQHNALPTSAILRLHPILPAYPPSPFPNSAPSFAKYFQ